MGHVIDSVLVPPTLDVTAFLATCPEVEPVVVVKPIVPVKPVEPTGDIVDRLGDLIDGIDLDDLGDTIGDAVGDVLGNNSWGDQIGQAIDTIVQSFQAIFSGESLSGWGGYFSGDW